MGLQGLVQKQLSTLGCLRQTQLLGIAVAVAAVVAISARVFLPPEGTQKELWLPSPDLLQHPARRSHTFQLRDCTPQPSSSLSYLRLRQSVGQGHPCASPWGATEAHNLNQPSNTTPSAPDHPLSIQAMAQCLPTIHPCLFPPPQDSAFRLACLPLRVSGGVYGLDCPTPSHVPALRLLSLSPGVQDDLTPTLHIPVPRNKVSTCS